jgi:antibiotic biosynthesis monooxygenase (ABM) superfamily enzyme
MNSASVSSKKESVPHRWKMALLTWIAVWPTSMFISLMLKPTLARNFPHVLAAGVVAGGIVVILYWIAMPLLVRVTRRWLCEHTDGALSDHDRLSSGVSFAAGFE